MKIRWKHGVGLCLLLIGGAALALFLFFATGSGQRIMRRAVIHAIADRTGARVEMGRFNFSLWNLRAEIDGLTLHGLESSSAQPLFHADRIVVDVRVLSFIHHKISLQELLIERPELAVSIDKQGHSNLPPRKPRPKGKPWQETLFNLQIAKLELTNGSASIGNLRIPLSAQGRNFDFALHYSGDSSATGVYLGTFD